MKNYANTIITLILVLFISNLGLSAGNNKRKKATSSSIDPSKGLFLILESLNREKYGVLYPEAKNTIAAMIYKPREKSPTAEKTKVKNPIANPGRKVQIKNANSSDPIISDLVLDDDETYASLRKKINYHPAIASYVARDPSSVAKDALPLHPILETFFKKHPKRPFYNIVVLGNDRRKLNDQKVKNLKDSSDLVIFVQGLNLEDADFSSEHCTCLWEIDFSYANLRNANFRNANCARANFQGADLYGANFLCSNLEHANFEDTNLEIAMFHDASIYKANFKNAYLKDAMIHGEDFTPEENKITKKQVALASWIEESESDSDSDSEIYFMVP